VFLNLGNTNKRAPVPRESCKIVNPAHLKTDRKSDDGKNNQLQYKRSAKINFNTKFCFNSYIIIGDKITIYQLFRKKNTK